MNLDLAAGRIDAMLCDVGTAEAFMETSGGSNVVTFGPNVFGGLLGEGVGAGMYIAKIFGYDGYIELHAFTIGTIAVGAISGAYSTEVIRGAVNSVHKGQFEAGKTLGLNGYGLYGRVIFPQVARIALPGIGNVWQITLKDTALISVTGLVEIMRQSRIAAGSTHEPFIFYTAAIILYLVITRLSNVLFDKAENTYSKGFVSKGAL